MKKIITIVFAIILGGAQAQEFKIAKAAGRLDLRIGRVEVEGYDGNEIVFSTRDHAKKDDERRKGLTEINGLGIEDNTGIGINVVEKDGAIVVRQLKRMNSPEIKIKVPKGITVTYQYESQYGGDVSFRNVVAEIEVSAQYNSVELVNVTGPITVKTIYGHVEASFDQNVKGPLSIVSVYGYADVTLPAAIKANLKLDTSYGELFIAPEFKLDVDRSGDDETRVSGKINGGGMEVSVSSSYGKVYVRKK